MAIIYYTDSKTHALEPLPENLQRTAEYIGEGLQNEKIATQMGIPLSSLRSNIKNIVEKTGFNRQEIAILVRDGQTYQRNKSEVPLTIDEIHIAGRVKQAMNPKNISEVTGIPLEEVKKHIDYIYKKTGAENSIQLARMDLGSLCERYASSKLLELKEKMALGNVQKRRSLTVEKAQKNLSELPPEERAISDYIAITNTQLDTAQETLLKFVSQGFSNPKIAEKMDIRVNTVSKHITKLCHIAGLTRDELAILIRNGKTYLPERRDLKIAPKEAELIQYTKEGLSPEAITERLARPRNSVLTGLAQLYSKVGAHNSIELASKNFGEEFVQVEKNALANVQRKMQNHILNKGKIHSWKEIKEWAATSDSQWADFIQEQRGASPDKIRE